MSNNVTYAKPVPTTGTSRSYTINAGEYEQMELPFLGKRKSGVTCELSEAEAWVRLTKNGRPSISFYDGVWARIGNPIVMAESNDRLYFCEDQDIGYRLQFFGNNGACLQLIKTTPCGKMLAKYLGSYRLEYDEKLRYYYIDKKHELSKMAFIGKGARA